MKSVTIND